MGFPEDLRYQWKTDLNISDRCCTEFKEKPMDEWAKLNNKSWMITGLMSAEGGRRASTKCIWFFRGRKTFNPLAKVSKDWENWYVSENNIQLSELYYEPINFDRSGCRGCPFNPKLQDDLTILEKYFPEERKAAELTFKYVYDEYRRIGYRLDKEEQMKLF